MVKSVLSVNHQGFSDWLIQRISAVLMVIYVIGLAVFFILHPGVTYYEWQYLFAHWWMKITTLLVFLSLLYHAWVGMWTIFTDYVTCAIGRLFLESIVMLALIGFFFAALFIMWGV